MAAWVLGPQRAWHFQGHEAPVRWLWLPGEGLLSGRPRICAAEASFTPLLPISGVVLMRILMLLSSMEQAHVNGSATNSTAEPRGPKAMDAYHRSGVGQPGQCALCHDARSAMHRHSPARSSRTSRASDSMS